jgi:GNAT superfamily N-acetyltransferase
MDSSPMDVSFKPIERSDIETLFVFIQEYYEYDRHPLNTARIRTALENLIRHPDWGQVWLIYRNKEPIGYVVLTLGYSLEAGGREALVDEIYIREGDRGQGIGRALLHESMKVTPLPREVVN